MPTNEQNKTGHQKEAMAETANESRATIMITAGASVGATLLMVAAVHLIIRYIPNHIKSVS